MALLATLAYAGVATLSKYQSRFYPVEMIVWVRYAFPLAVLMGIYLPRRGRRLLRTRFPLIQLARGVLLVGGTVMIVLAYRSMPVAEAQAISFIHPVLLTLMAVLFLGEKVGRFGWLAVVLGFLGVLIIVRPSGNLFTPTALLPLGLALTFSLYQMLTRLIAGKDDSISSLFYALLIGTACMSLVLCSAWVTPDWVGVLWFLLIGLASGLGHYSTIKALEFAPASTLAPYAYFQLIWVSVFGLLVFGELPDAITAFGMIVVALSGVTVATSRHISGKSA